ncbi:MAG TPA: hypothetical protein VLL97_14265 [Acidobacteriota bacterium]|nr:hypothetical protein [Acidobacteriota bacterium]
MKKYAVAVIVVVVILIAVSSLHAGEVILYGGLQKPGKLEYAAAAELPASLLEGTFGGTYGIRFSGGGIVGMEQNISFSPRFAVSGVRAFQMDTNLLLQAPGKIVPYATAGLGFIVTWGQGSTEDMSPAEIAARAFSFGRQFSLNYGGGIKVRRLIGSMGLNADFRGYTIPSARDGSLNFIQSSLGLVFTW